MALGAVIAVGTIAVVFGGEAAISRTEFCVSCHSETYPYEELKKSSHWGALGSDPGCKDCHVPQGLQNFHLAVWTRVVDGLPFVIDEFTIDYSTIEKFNERRPAAAYKARMKLKGWDSLTCRACHKNTKPPGASAKAAHAKMQTEGNGRQPIHPFEGDSMATLRLKMVVNTVARYCDNNGDTQSEEITLSAVTSDKEGSANKQWSRWTPCGQLKFTVNNAAAFGKVLPGQFLYVDLVPTDKDSL